ncbi:hypothetical protein TrRE_jg4597 [Triparma retinervis]|uniref:non-specific serine/threonine protein kinase n=1 Tax=Triparma retinervis TaxID=2557542 RepID=A0A9W7CBB5_9STRA|nr:hypothetical protein TrRE_jg4597 [Triparma retinervis]
MRERSLRYLTKLPFDGFAIGGSLGGNRDEMVSMLGTVMSSYRSIDCSGWGEEPGSRTKPVHLLGIADTESIGRTVGMGIDTYDSCFPTRLARHGTLLTRGGKVHIKNRSHRKSYGIPIEEGIISSDSDDDIRRRIKVAGGHTGGIGKIEGIKGRMKGLQNPQVPVVGMARKSQQRGINVKPTAAQLTGKAMQGNCEGGGCLVGRVVAVRGKERKEDQLKKMLDFGSASPKQQPPSSTPPPLHPPTSYMPQSYSPITRKNSNLFTYNSQHRNNPNPVPRLYYDRDSMGNYYVATNPSIERPGGSRGGGGQGYYSGFGGDLSRGWMTFGSWIPPLIALLAVAWFEHTRRRAAGRQGDIEQSVKLKVPPSPQAAAAATAAAATAKAMQARPASPASPARPGSPAVPSSVGLITLTTQILGYGGHGTVVYSGHLNGRSVAVKRMLRTYDSSASNEIDLLVRTDNHPNLIRYFIKEQKGEFVYLALEKCERNLMSAIEKSREFGASSSSGVRQALSQVASGVHHLHGLRIVHRDLKPQNILLKPISEKQEVREKGDEGEFEYERYTCKISDMGLGKQLSSSESMGSMGNSSLGTHGNTTGGAEGSVGWQAPEVMRRRGRGGGKEKEEVKGKSNKFSSDIFSLGCVFHSVICPTSHPFGNWYEREANIINGNPVELGELKARDETAWDLVRGMIHPDQSARPSAAAVCAHPYFWPPPARMSFLVELSNRLEEDGPVSPLALLMESNASRAIGTDFTARLDKGLLADAARYRSYDQASVVDCLRFIRNKNNHEGSIPSEVRARIGDLPSYFNSMYPYIAVHCWRAAAGGVGGGDPFAGRWGLEHGMEGAEPLSEPMSCVIIWSGSDAAKKYGGKGWLRSEAEWEGRVEETLTKEAGWTGSEKMDSKFRTRLCTNWMRSGGAGCAMLKKGKCVFAHSPCELRVKEGKRQRWGTLVNADGESSNPRASGGEDTFSPAMDVEQQRLEEGN